MTTVEAEPQEKTTTLIEPGMVLLAKEPPFEEGGNPRVKLWTVTHVNNRKHENVTLLGWAPGIKAKATATFPDKEIREPWKLLALSARDLVYLWEKLPS